MEMVQSVLRIFSMDLESARHYEVSYCALPMLILLGARWCYQPFLYLVLYSVWQNLFQLFVLWLFHWEGLFQIYFIPCYCHNLVCYINPHHHFIIGNFSMSQSIAFLVVLLNTMLNLIFTCVKCSTRLHTQMWTAAVIQVSTIRRVQVNAIGFFFLSDISSTCLSWWRFLVIWSFSDLGDFLNMSTCHCREFQVIEHKQALHRHPSQYCSSG